jgi:hypothetical protein
MTSRTEGPGAGRAAGVVPWQRRLSRPAARRHRVPLEVPVAPPALDLYEVLDNQHHPAFADLGRLLWTLVVTQWQWVDRRVETASLTGERSYRQRMSIDCRVPPAVVDLADELGFDRFAVPLRFEPKEPLLSLDLRLGERSVPLLTRRQSAQVTCAVLRAAVEQLELPITPEIEEEIAAVASDEHESAEAALQLLALTEPASPGGQATTAQLAHWAVTTFDTSYLLLADVGVDDVRQRVIFKISQEVGPTLHGAQEMTLSSLLAWQPAPLFLDTTSVTSTSSYHFQFDAPPGLVVAGGQLFGKVKDDPLGRSFGTSASQGSVLGLHANLHEVPDADGYAAAVLVHPSPDGTLRSCAVSACFSTVLLFLALVVANRIDSSRLEAAAGLLLVVPGIVSTFLARPGEHYWVSRLLRGVRVMTLANAVIVYLAAAVLVTGVVDSANRKMWLVFMVLSAIPSAVLAVAVRRCRSVWT